MLTRNLFSLKRYQENMVHSSFPSSRNGEWYSGVARQLWIGRLQARGSQPAYEAPGDLSVKLGICAVINVGFWVMLSPRSGVKLPLGKPGY